jgi:hypothetical protein
MRLQSKTLRCLTVQTCLHDPHPITIVTGVTELAGDCQFLVLRVTPNAVTLSNTCKGKTLIISQLARSLHGRQ